MYLGRRMEIAPKQEFYSNALHPYTKALLSAIPLIDPTKKKERIILKGEVPSPSIRRRAAGSARAATA